MSKHPLDVVAVKLFPKEDGVAHHTDKFESSNGASYLRRGQEFHMVVSFAGRYDARAHRVLLALSTGRGDRLETSSDVLRVQEADDAHAWPPAPGEWGARKARKNHDRGVAIRVVTPTWLPVGEWRLQVQTELVNFPEVRSTRYSYTDPIYFLFNPWNKEDDSFMEDEVFLRGYLLNTMGHFWNEHPVTTWNFGQFEECVLPAFELAMGLPPNKSVLEHHRRGNAADVARAISQIAARIVHGYWRNNYSNGKKPTYWTGSAEILEMYLESGGERVRYGQCWVFAGIVATMCRALGLLARPVTNWSSGHDEDKSLILDTYFDEDLEVRHEEFIWNFHCWVDVWMRRPDIRQAEYSGWQIVDGTPQEESQGIYRCGPAPLKAVHDGDTQVPYDVPFVFGEVNGDRAFWVRKPEGRLQLIDYYEKVVGLAIMTDDPYSDNSLNITDQYKPPEGSIPERLAVWRAANNSPVAIARRRRQQLDSIRFPNDVAFKVNFPEELDFGDEFSASLDFTNTSKEDRTITTELVVVVVDNFNTKIDSIKKSGKLMLKLRPGESQTRGMWVAASEYASPLMENTYMQCCAKAWVRETDRAWHSYIPQRINLIVPRLYMEINDELRIGKTAVMHLRLDRTLDMPLTNCQLQLGGSAIERSGGGGPIQLADLYAGERFYIRIRLEPVRAGEQTISAKLTSAELPKVEAWWRVRVRSAPGSNRRALNFADHMDEILNDAFNDNFDL